MYRLSDDVKLKKKTVSGPAKKKSLENATPDPCAVAVDDEDVILDVVFQLAVFQHFSRRMGRI